MFKLNEIKEDIKYHISGTVKTQGKEYRIKKNGMMFDEYWHQQSSVENLKKTYEDTLFTCVYPKTIEEAAKILDAHCSNWVEKVKDGIRPHSPYYCVLGLNYECWETGMKTLFNLDVKAGDEHSKDTVFGSEASVDTWMKEIKSRLSTEPAKKEKELTFQEALEAVKAGKKISRNGWVSTSYWQAKGDNIIWDNVNNSGAPVEILSFISHTGWRIHTEITFADIKLGNDFKFGDITFKKIRSGNQNVGLNLTTHSTQAFDNNIVVEKL